MIKFLLPYLENKENSFLRFLKETNNYQTIVTNSLNNDKIEMKLCKVNSNYQNTSKHTSYLKNNNIVSQSPNVTTRSYSKSKVFDILNKKRSNNENSNIDRYCSTYYNSNIENDDVYVNSINNPKKIAKFNSDIDLSDLNNNSNIIELKNNQNKISISDTISVNNVNNQNLNKNIDNYESFFNLKEKVAIHEHLESSDQTLNTKLFSDNPIDLLAKYTKESTSSNNNYKDIKLANQYLNSIVDSLKKLPIIINTDTHPNLIKEISNSIDSKKTISKNLNLEKVKNKEIKKYTCEICNKELPNASSKGGHMRAYHKGQSEKYRKKKEKADSRQEARNLYAIAHSIWIIKSSSNKKMLSKTVEIKNIKKKLIELGFPNINTSVDYLIKKYFNK